MPRVARSSIVLPGQPHHLTLRGNNRRRLFSRTSCFLYFLGLLGHATRGERIPIHALALMTNHVHLVVTPEDAPSLGRFVKRFAQPYAWRRNRAKEASGSLFEERYGCVPIVGERQLALTLAYVDRNPVRAGLIDDAADYLWSTYRSHTLHTHAAPAVTRVWTPHAWYVGLGTDERDRAETYREWVLERVAADELEAVALATNDRDDERTHYRRRQERPWGVDVR